MKIQIPAILSVENGITTIYPVATGPNRFFGEFFGVIQSSSIIEGMKPGLIYLTISDWDGKVVGKTDRVFGPSEVEVEGGRP